MNTTNLHDMPKDMLIKLIATIREDAVKETFKDTMKLVEERLNSNKHRSASLMYLHSCKNSDCKYFEISEYYHTHKHLKKCYRCGNLYCDKHLSVNKKCHN